MIYRVLGFVFLLKVISSGVAWAAADRCTQPNVSGPPVWPPYIVNSENGYTGQAFDMADQVIKPIVGEYSLNFGRPWARVVDELKHGRQDIVLAMLHSPEREQHYVFTKPWVYDRYAIVVNSGSTMDYQGLESLRGRKGAYLNGVNLPEPFKSFVAGNPLMTPSPNATTLMRKIEAERVDFLIASVDAFIALFQDEYDRNVFRYMEDSVVKIPVHMAISRKSACAELIGQINQAISGFKGS